MARARAERPAPAGAAFERGACEVFDVVDAPGEALVRQRADARVDVVQRPPLTPPVDEHGALPRDAPLAVGARERLGVVDERDRVERRPEEDDLAGALDDARVRRAVAVRVVQRMRKRNRLGFAADGGDARLRMARVDRAGPGAERLRDTAVVASRAPGCRVVDGLLRKDEVAVGRRECVEVVRRRVVPPHVGHERPVRRDGVEQRPDDGLRAANHRPEGRHPAVDERHGALPQPERGELPRELRPADEHAPRLTTEPVAGPRARMGHVPATVIVGAQWGDEGKGKIVDLLAQESDLVCRYQGGPNAGHTIVVEGETYKIRAIPSGIVAGVASAIGAGCVVDPAVLIEELDDLESRGHRTDGLVFVSGNAHLIMPWHVALDGARERRLGNLQIGTTRRGIGPAYADKATRIGIRVQDLLDPKILREKVELAAGEKNVWLERVYGIEPFDVEEVVARTLGHAERLAAYVEDTSLLVDRALREGRDVLFEGAQGTLLDLDHGTYPFVTSSSPIAAGAAVSFGIGPQRIDDVVGVAKAYVTRVGEGPFPSEITGPAQERVRELGGEFGTVTGRERRCGWLDLVALRFAVRVNGITSLALTKLDVLSGFDEIPVCVRYRLPDGSETEDFPAHQSDFHHCEPVFETLPGWREELLGPSLPPAASGYVAFVAESLDVPVTLVGTGAARDAVLALQT